MGSAVVHVSFFPPIFVLLSRNGFSSLSPASFSLSVFHILFFFLPSFSLSSSSFVICIFLFTFPILLLLSNWGSIYFAEALHLLCFLVFHTLSISSQYRFHLPGQTFASHLDSSLPLTTVAFSLPISAPHSSFAHRHPTLSAYSDLSYGTLPPLFNVCRITDEVKSAA